MGIDVLSLTGSEPSIVSWKATLAERVAANTKVIKEAVDKGAIITTVDFKNSIGDVGIPIRPFQKITFTIFKS